LAWLGVPVVCECVIYVLGGLPWSAGCSWHIAPHSTTATAGCCYYTLCALSAGSVAGHIQFPHTSDYANTHCM